MKTFKLTYLYCDSKDVKIETITAKSHREAVKYRNDQYLNCPDAYNIRITEIKKSEIFLR